MPKEVKPEVKNAHSMEAVWKILDVRYGQPHVVSDKLIKELLGMKFTVSEKQDRQKFIKLHTAYIKARNNLEEIGQLESLRNGPIINSVVKKLPSLELKLRWSSWQKEKEELLTAFSMRMHRCEDFLNLSLTDRVTLVEKAGGCVLLLPVQDIRIMTDNAKYPERSGLIFFDSRSTLCLIITAFAT